MVAYQKHKMRWMFWLFIGLAMTALAGVCWSYLYSWTAHRRAGFYAEEVFDDPQVVELCLAIEHGNLRKMERLIEEGVDVNARGRDNLTPLFWAFFGGHEERMEVLLKHGANPNISITKEYAPASMPNGTSVTELAARAPFPGCFELVMEYGGDPNFVNPVSKRPLLFAVISGFGDRMQRSRLLVDKGADVTVRDGQGYTAPFIAAISWAKCDVALFLLEAGADPSVPQSPDNIPLIVRLILAEEHYGRYGKSPQKQREYQALLDWLVEHGESLEDARTTADYLSKTPRELRRKTPDVPPKN